MAKLRKQARSYGGVLLRFLFIARLWALFTVHGVQALEASAGRTSSRFNFGSART